VRKAKQLDREQKQIHVDNQLNTLLASLLKLETAYKEQERDRIEHNKQMADLMNQKSESEFVLRSTRDGILRVADTMKAMLEAFPFDKTGDPQAAQFYNNLLLQQAEMEDMAKAEWKTSTSTLTNSGGLARTTPVPNVVVVESIPVPPPTAPPPMAPMAPAAPPMAPMAPAAPPPTILALPPTNFLAGIQGGVAGLKKVDPRDLEKNKASPLGGIFESLHDTLTAGMFLFLLMLYLGLVGVVVGEECCVVVVEFF